MATSAERIGFKMKKTLKILTTTTASTLLVSLTSGCGTEQQNQTNQDTDRTELKASEASKQSSEIRLSITESQGSLDALRCIGNGRCVLQDR
jgi:hypothetical protein